MPLRIRCPLGCSFNAPVLQAGQKVRCPVCRVVIQIPTLEVTDPQQELEATLAQTPVTSPVILTDPFDQASPSEESISITADSGSIVSTETEPSATETHASEMLPSPDPSLELSHDSRTIEDTPPLDSPAEMADQSVPQAEEPASPTAAIENEVIATRDEGVIASLSESTEASLRLTESTSTESTAALVSPPEASPSSISVPLHPAKALEADSFDGPTPSIEPTEVVRKHVIPRTGENVLKKARRSQVEPEQQEAANRDHLTSEKIGSSNPSIVESAPIVVAESVVEEESRVARPIPSVPNPEPPIDSESPRSMETPVLETSPSEQVPSAAAIQDQAYRDTDMPKSTLSDLIPSGAASSDMPFGAAPVVETAVSLASGSVTISAVPAIQLDRSRLAVFEVKRHQASFETTRRTVARIIAFLILCLGIANIAIGLIQSGWIMNPATSELRTWAIVLILLGGLHGAYAALLAQISDWSAHWVSAIFLLLVAISSAAAAVVLGLARPDHGLIQWLELPTLLQVQGAIWSLCMVLMSASLAWWCGREAISWRTVVSQLQRREAARHETQVTPSEF